MTSKNPLRPAVMPTRQPGAGPLQGPAAQFFQRHHGNPLGRPAIDRSQLPEVIQQVLAQPVSIYEELRSLKPGPMDTPLTNVAFVLDKSSSMETGKSATIEGFNDQVRVVTEGAKTAGETTFTEVQFSSGVEVRRVAAALSTMSKLTNETYVPSGWTALYDALGDTICALLMTPRIGSVLTANLVTLFTDGEENQSTRYDTEILSELIKRLEATGRWTFALVGPRGGVTTLAKLLAVKQTNVAGYNPASVEERVQVMGRMSSASASYMNMRSMGVTQACALYGDENNKV